MAAIATAGKVLPLIGHRETAREPRRTSGRSSMSLRAGPGTFWGAAVDIPSCSSEVSPRWGTSGRGRSLKIEMAISKAKKELTVERVKKELEDCTLVASINYKTFTVKQFQLLRRNLPTGVTLYVCKNRLLGKAIEDTPFVALKPAMKGMNAYLFVHTEEVPPALKPYRDMQKEMKLEENDFRGAVFEGKFYGPEEFKMLETMPSRLEVYAKLLGILKSPATSIVSTLKAPSVELVFTLKAYVAKLEEEQGGAAASS